ncbi:MAG TPA: RecX family transcriptional regulator [Thermoanaerobaculia bacterium]
MRILQYRFNSEAELRRKLRRKEFDAEAIDETIARLKRERWLDDARFAGAFVRTRALRKIGRRRLLRELQAAGVDDDNAAKAVRENVDEEREREAAQQLCARRARALVRRHGADYIASDEGREKLIAYLIGRGYELELARAAVRAL